MTQTYQATYKDKFGSEAIEIVSDGSSLRFQLRGIAFEGWNFGFLSPVKRSEAGNTLFEWTNDHDLTHFELTIRFPIRLSGPKFEGILSTRVVCNIDKWELNEVIIHDIILSAGEKILASHPCTDSFEGVIMLMQMQIIPEIKLECCLSCRWSHYNPGGDHGFGDLTCLRECKKEAALVTDKHALMDLTAEVSKNGKGLGTQETWICPDFQEIKTGDWCYKDWRF